MAYCRTVTLVASLLVSALVEAGSCGGVTHPNISANSAGDYGLVPASFSAVCQVSSAGVSPGYIEENLTLTSNVLWVLDGAVQVGLSIVGGAQNPISDSNAQFAAVLTIEPGTTLIGDYDPLDASSNLDYLVIHRGSRILASATEDAPIRMTSRQALTGELEQPGQWGGLVINGYAQVNHCSSGDVVVDCEASASLGGGQFGGNNVDDTSGVLEYMRIENAGFQLSPNNGFSALSLNGTGDQTRIDNLQIHHSGGVSLSINGGSVNLQRTIITEGVDSALAWSNGWTGTAQHMLAIVPVSGGSAVVGRNHTNELALPRSSPFLINTTLISHSTDAAIALSDGTAAQLLAQVIVSGNGSCYQHTDVSTAALSVSHSYVNCSSVGVGQTETNWFVGGLFNLSSPDVGLNAYVNNSLVYQAVTPRIDGVSGAEPTSYIGAVGYCSDDWTQGWSIALPALNEEQCLARCLQIPLLNPLAFTGLSLLLVGIANGALHE